MLPYGLTHAADTLVDFEICPFVLNSLELQSKHQAVEPASKAYPRLAEIDPSCKAVRLFENVIAGTIIALQAVYSSPSSPSRFFSCGIDLVARAATAALENLYIRKSPVERNQHLDPTLPAGAFVEELGYSSLRWTRTVELRLLEHND